MSTELLDPALTETAFGTLVQRDRIVLALALTLLIAVTWSYLLWLSVDMVMGGMDATGFRIGSGRHGTHDAGALALAGDGVRIRIRHVDCDDGRHDDAPGDANDFHVRPRG